MNVATGMMSMRNKARRQAEHVTHQVKDKALQMRADRSASEADTLRTENRMLRDEVETSRSERLRLFDVLERFADKVEVEIENEDEGKEKKRRGGLLWMILLLGGAFVAIRAIADRMSGSSQMYADETTGGVRTGSGDAGFAAA